MPIDVDKLLELLYGATYDDRRMMNITLGGVIMSAQEQGAAATVEELLQRADPTKLLDSLCLCLLMSTFSCKSHYPSWESARQRVADTIIARHGQEKARKMMLGFIIPSVPQKVTADQTQLDQLLGVHPTMVRHVGQEW